MSNILKLLACELRVSTGSFADAEEDPYAIMFTCLDDPNRKVAFPTFCLCGTETYGAHPFTPPRDVHRHWTAHTSADERAFCSIRDLFEWISRAAQWGESDRARLMLVDCEHRGTDFWIVFKRLMAE